MADLDKALQLARLLREERYPIFPNLSGIANEFALQTKAVLQSWLTADTLANMAKSVFDDAAIAHPGLEAAMAEMEKVRWDELSAQMAAAEEKRWREFAALLAADAVVLAPAQEMARLVRHEIAEMGSAMGEAVANTMREASSRTVAENLTFPATWLGTVAPPSLPVIQQVRPDDHEVRRRDRKIRQLEAELAAAKHEIMELRKQARFQALGDTQDYPANPGSFDAN
jgi:hypothetical protein